MSKIEWTHRPGTKSEVWNTTSGCDKVSQGCRNCYAEVMHKRLRGMGQPKYQHKFLGEVKMHPEEILKPLRWKKPRTVFVDSMSDLFHKDVTDEHLDKVFAMMVLTWRHTYQILTKRADRLHEYFSVGKDALIQRWEDATYALELADKNEDPDAPACNIFNMCNAEWPRKNIWIGVSAEDQHALNERLPHLLETDAAIRFVSYEPALGSINLQNYFSVQDLKKLHWVIAGGESGHNARPAHPDWFQFIQDQCKAFGIKFFFKQWGEWAPFDQLPKTLQREIKSGKTKHKIQMFDDGRYVYHLHKAGKSKTGNLLDGVQHLEFPG